MSNSLTFKFSQRMRQFLKACINPENWEYNPILLDYINPELCDEIEGLLGEQNI